MEGGATCAAGAAGAATCAANCRPDFRRSERSNFGPKGILRPFSFETDVEDEIEELELSVAPEFRRLEIPELDG